MRAALVLLVLFIAHTASLWDVKNNLAGGYGDPLAHAAMPGWYCSEVVTWNLHTPQFLAPQGAKLNNNYDSGFPLILTCPFQGLGSHVQFHIFAALEVLLILITSLLVARVLFPQSVWWQLAYVLTAWWTGFYIARVHQHFTLLAGIWGFQLLLWMMLTVRWQERKNAALQGVLLGLIFAGSFHNIAMLGFPALIFLIFEVIKKRPPVVNVAIAGLTCFATFFFFFGPSLVGFVTDDLPRAFTDRGFYNLDLASPFMPYVQNYIYTWFDFPAPLTYERFNAFSLVALALLLYKRRSSPFMKPLAIIAGMSFICSLGPSFQWMGEEIAENPLDAILSKIPPLSFSRTPARFAAVTNLALIYLAFAPFQNSKSKWIPALAIAVTVITGPLMNRMWTLPTVEYQQVFPMKGYAMIKEASDGIVVMIPNALSSDPTQNFGQLFHEKPITTGYLAYTALTEQNVSFIRQDPFLNQMGCEYEAFQFRSEPPLTNSEALRVHLQNNQFKFIVANKMILSDPRCQRLFLWLKGLTQVPWLRLLEENERFAVFAVD